MDKTSGSAPSTSSSYPLEQWRLRQREQPHDHVWWQLFGGPPLEYSGYRLTRAGSEEITTRLAEKFPANSGFLIRDLVTNSPLFQDRRCAPAFRSRCMCKCESQHDVNDCETLRSLLHRPPRHTPSASDDHFTSGPHRRVRVSGIGERAQRLVPERGKDFT